MNLWIVLTITAVVLAVVATAITLVVLYLKKRAKARANEDYLKSITDQSLIAANLDTQAQVINNVDAVAQDSLGQIGDSQDITFSQVADSKAQLDQLQQNLAAATLATNALSVQKNAQDTANKADTALTSTKSDLSFLQKTKDTIQQNTAKGLQIITAALQQQNDALKAFKDSLQQKAITMAREVNVPSINLPKLKSKPSVRTIWDAAIQLVVTAPTQDVAIKQLGRIYTVTQKDSDDLKQAANEYKNPKQCERIPRVLIDGTWKCPDGFTDTGRNWGDVDGYIQCTRGPCDALKPNTCGYTRRVSKNGRYECPFGYKDTGRPATSPYQCFIGPCGPTPADPPPPPPPAPAPAPSPSPSPSPSPGPSPSPSNVHGIPSSVTSLLGLDASQVDTILSLINGPEQATVQWWKGADGKSVYGYCENIADGRGVTVGIAGFVSKYGEVQALLKAYGADNVGNPNDCPSRSSNCALCRWIQAHGDDPKWIQVQWDRYVSNFIKGIPGLVPSQFKGNALIIGLLWDTAMNSGYGDEGNAWGVDHLARAASGSTPLAWVNSFCDLRYDHFAAGNSASSRKGRLDTWRRLAADGKWDLRNVDVCKYAFCYGKCGGC